MKEKGKVVLITGASSGIGQSCTEFLSKKGYMVFGTSRRFPEPEMFTTNGLFYTMNMDVTNGESVKKVVEAIVKKCSGIDVLVNNAGYGIAGAIEDVLLKEAENQFLVNFFGAFNLIRAVLPIMRKQNSGLIINISSLASLYPLPFQGFYSASKTALDALTEALAMELESISANIKVVSILPADYRTNFTKNRQKIKFWESSVYLKKAEKTLEVSESGERNGPDPVEIARLVEEIIKKKSRKIHYPIGPNTKLLFIARKIFPDFLRLHLLKKYFNI